MNSVLMQLLPYLTPANVALVIGQGMPLVVEVINKYVPAADRKVGPFTINFSFVSTLVVSAIVGGLTAATAGKLVPSDIVGDAMIVFASSQVAYHTWFNNSNVQSKLQG